MNQNKNFAASLMASVGSFVALPLTFYWAFTALEAFERGVNFLYIAFIAMFVLAVAVLVMETVAMARGKEMGKVYNMVAMVLNALFAVLSLVVLVLLLVDFGAFDFEVFYILCMYYLPVLFAGAANGTAFGFKLFNMLKK